MQTTDGVHGALTVPPNNLEDVFESAVVEGNAEDAAQPQHHPLHLDFHDNLNQQLRSFRDSPVRRGECSPKRWNKKLLPWEKPHLLLSGQMM